MKEAPVLIFIVNSLAVAISKSLTTDERVSEICNTFFFFFLLCDWLDTDGELYAALALGYADETPPARPRKEMEDVVEWRTKFTL